MGVSSRHAYDELAEVLAAQQPDEAAGSALEPFDHFLTLLHASLAQPARHVLEEGGKAPVVVEDDETLDLQAPAQHGVEKRRRVVDARRQLLEVVPGNQAAQRH